MDKRRCVVCRAVFTVRAQTPQQCYCAAPACQRERRRRWQREKRRNDPDYRENQRQAQQRWAAGQPQYWRGYRAKHPEYTAANRAQQRERDQRRREREAAPSAGVDLAKSDASARDSHIFSGTYRLIPVTRQLAKMDVWTVEIHPISEA